MQPRSLVNIGDYDQQDIFRILESATKFKQNPDRDLLKGKVCATLFFEPSTRTRLSFETAVSRLRGRIIGFSDSATSSSTKGESLKDTIMMVSNYADLIIMRHHLEGSARYASEISPVPIINAGDGSNQHPTQTLLDLFSIYETQGTLDGLKLAFVGDLKYGRTVHSLAQALSLFGARFYFISPEALAMPDYICEELTEKGIEFSFHDTIEEVMPELDILYMTRVQKERFEESEYRHIAAKFVLLADELKTAKPNMKILHPLPRVDEIHTDVDDTNHAYYFQQAGNGVYARQALLALVLNEEV